MVGSSLGNLFAKSPIKPLQQHIEVVSIAAALLTDFFAATFEDDWGKAEAVYDKIREKEHEADDLKKQIRLSMPRSLFMPIARNDLLSLVSHQDKIANLAKDVAGLSTGRKFAFPKSLQSDVEDFVAAVVKAAAATEATINELDELLETGFSGPELDVVKEHIVNLDQLEDEADRLEINLRASLRAIEADLPPIDAMFLYRSIAQIGTLADQAQKVGDQLYIIIAR